ncbi:hypothetical protein MM2B1231_1088 [Mycobacteroides abscessus subsp. bolletii 2B-1231]|nr:hypothetical protein MM2B0307_0355 [Mycobacteroides abscessus subsp. bolletii 2B-0307]EIV27334.1 hypothetical protein MM2B0912S_1027 [Mycobacteroides abscessus subsp. bolletii 2B-0912-S]EIV80575.1 hypothetical protein MM2B1231_1088 [Mycobacteroides abscessus subsp. bolletii 2B-1231]EIV80970.1 hypothetical protein MM2B0107_0363 [Mycobacteroides abscessus subsp. bolletii 2B-0107]ESV58936.1 hypothetical protein L830_4788 [Mycobacteroides abscessus MAB_082312_2258]
MRWCSDGSLLAPLNKIGHVSRDGECLEWQRWPVDVDVSVDD